MINFFKNSGIETAYLRDLSSRCDAINGINLSQGVCDNGAPARLLEEASKSILAGNNSYSSHFGEDNLRDAIANKANKFNALNITRQNVAVTSGATGGFICTCMALLEKDDEVILLEPFYPYHLITLKALGIIVKTFKYSDTIKQVIDFDELEKLVTPRTKAILLCTPSNPTGKVLTRDELLSFSLIANKYDLYVISDEIYEYITYNKSMPHISPAAIDALFPRSITISGFSKTYAVTGWRVGYVIASEKITKKIALVNDFYYICAPTPFQAALSVAIKSIDSLYYEELKLDYMSKRDFMIEALGNAGMHSSTPNGAYYLMCSCPDLPGESSLEKALYLLDKTGIAAVPGQSFFLNPNDGNNILRFCFAKSDNLLHEAQKKLALL